MSPTVDIYLRKVRLGEGIYKVGMCVSQERSINSIRTYLRVYLLRRVIEVGHYKACKYGKVIKLKQRK